VTLIIEPWLVPPEGVHLTGEIAADMLDLEPGSEPRPEGPVQYELTVLFTSGQLIVSGTVGGRVAFVCSRCAEGFTANVRDPAFNCVLEVPDEHLPLDLPAEIRGSMILHFPTFPLCQPSCRGLCVRCGANLNRTACDCGQSDDGRWGAFDGL
jgi:uncharacterized protein